MSSKQPAKPIENEAAGGSKQFKKKARAGCWKELKSADKTSRSGNKRAASETGSGVTKEEVEGGKEEVAGVDQTRRLGRPMNLEPVVTDSFETEAYRRSFWSRWFIAKS